MKSKTTQSIVIFLALFGSGIVVSCNQNKSHTITQEVISTGKTAKQLYSEGIEILNERVSIQSSDREKAIALNKKAIEKFSAAYQIDTMFAKPVLLASECTMFARDYQNCIYWTSKLIKLDSSQTNQQFCIERIDYCKKQLKI